jgi:7tm Chemosensory receptor
MAASNPIFMQMILLQCLGFLPLYESVNKSKTPKWRRFLQPILCFIAVCFLVGTLACSATQWAISLWQLIYPPDSKGNRMFLVNMFTLLPYCTFIVRALFVLTTLFCKRNSWMHLFNMMQEFVQEAFPAVEIRQKLLIKWRSYSAALFLLTLALHVSWDVFHWHESMMKEPEMSMMSEEHSMGPLPIKIVTWKFLFFWELFSSLSFILSQQVLVSVMIFAMMIGDGLKNLNKEVQEKTKSDENSKIMLHNELLEEEKKVPFEMEEKIRIWKKLHGDALRSCEKINGHFGLILLTIYGLDFVALLAFGANVLINARGTVDSYAYYVCSFLLFASYGTLFLIPLVICHEQVP